MNLRCCLLAAGLLFLPAAARPAQGPHNTVVFDGETYVRMHAERQSNGDRVVQFLRERETFESWTQAIGYYRYTTMGNDPTQAAYALRDIIKAANPDAQASIVIHTVTRDALIEFLTWPADGRYMEFTIVRYSKSADGKGLVAFQFFHRFRDTKVDTERYNNRASNWRDQALEFDIARIHAMFGD